MNNIVKVVVDSSALLAIEEFKADIFQLIKEELAGKILFLIPSSVISELESLAKNKGKKGLKAKTAFLVIKKHEDEIDIPPYKGIVDKSVISLALDEDAYIATSDREMKNKALRRGLKVIVIRGKKIEVL